MFGLLFSWLFALITGAIGLLALYFVIRIAVRDGLKEGMGSIQQLNLRKGSIKRRRK